MAEPTDWGEVAVTVTRDQFVDLYPHPFLYARRVLVKPPRPQRTEKHELTGLLRLDEEQRAQASERPVVLAIKKVQPAFPSMITVGRTQNNDVVVEDVQVSKFHAFFRTSGSEVLVGDSGSSNGTWVRGVRLEPKGPTVTVGTGDVIAFAAIEFELVTPALCWDKLIAAMDRWGD